MVVVALAGASTGLGLTILRQIVATNKHTVIMLSRKPNPSISALGVEVRPVDYTSHASLVSALKGVHTLLSAIGSLTKESLTDAQIALINAAKEAGVKRWSGSDYAIPSYDDMEAYSTKIPVWEAAKQSGLQVTRFSPGLFMNILATGTPKGEDEALNGLPPWNFIINVRAGTADFAGSPMQKTTFTDTNDIGKFVAAALDLDEWPLELEMVGDTRSWAEIVELLEKVQKRKFLVKENSVPELEAQIEKIPATQFYNQSRIAIANGRLVVQPTLNNLCPQVKPMSLEDFVEKWWGGVVDLPEPKWEQPKIFGQDDLTKDRNS